MILVSIGTKGQLIKMVGTIRELRKSTDQLTVVDQGQHGRMLPELASQFGVRFDLKMSRQSRDLVSVKEVAPWLLRQILSPFEATRSDLFVTHGDAPPALACLAWAKRSQSRIVHVEAGERTYRLTAPFPEEIVRRILDRNSDLMLACSSQAFSNLIRERARGKIVNLGVNTLLDTTRIAVSAKPSIAPPSGPFVLASIHRFETLSSRRRLTRVLRILQAMSRDVKIVLPLHGSTRSALYRFGLLHVLENNPEIVAVNLLDYFSFIHHIRASEAILTDGGGPQEESFYLGVPCLLLREFTERPEHENIVVCGLGTETVLRALRRIGGTRFESHLLWSDVSPSVHAAREILALHEEISREA
jgi:UDP-N-acetylglucosamine 2-epimerase (non-hydrolysing)